MVDEPVEQQVPELMGVSEAAECLGVATGNLSKVRGLPAPVVALRAGKFYLASEIRALAEEQRQAAVTARAAAARKL
jgi:hypothetical protein